MAFSKKLIERKLRLTSGYDVTMDEIERVIDSGHCESNNPTLTSVDTVYESVLGHSHFQTYLSRLVSQYDRIYHHLWESANVESFEYPVRIEYSTAQVVKHHIHFLAVEWISFDHPDFTDSGFEVFGCRFLEEPFQAFLKGTPWSCFSTTDVVIDCIVLNIWFIKRFVLHCFTTICINRDQKAVVLFGVIRILDNSFSHNFHHTVLPWCNNHILVL